MLHTDKTNKTSKKWDTASNKAQCVDVQQLYNTTAVAIYNL